MALVALMCLPVLVQAQFEKEVYNGAGKFIKKLVGEETESLVKEGAKSAKNAIRMDAYVNRRISEEEMALQGFPTRTDLARKLDRKAEGIRRDFLQSVIDQELQRQADLPLSERNALKYSNADWVRFDIREKQFQKAGSIVTRRNMEFVLPEDFNKATNLFRSVNADYIPADKVNQLLQDGTLIPYRAAGTEHGFIEYSFVVFKNSGNDVIVLPNGIGVKLPNYLHVRIPLEYPEMKGIFAMEMPVLSAHLKTMIYANQMKGFIYKNGSIVGEKSPEQVYKELRTYFEDAVATEKYQFVNKRTPLAVRWDELLGEKPATSLVEEKNVYVLTKDITVFNTWPELGNTATIKTYPVRLAVGSRIVKSQDGYVWRVFSPEEFDRFYKPAPAPQAPESPAD